MLHVRNWKHTIPGGNTPMWGLCTWDGGGGSVLWLSSLSGSSSDYRANKFMLPKW